MLYSTLAIKKLGKEGFSVQTLWQLYSTFFRIGILTFGGGYAMLPMITREIVEKHGWATEENIMDYYVIAQCTPGIIAVNTATFVGARVGGNLGGLVATLGVVSPSYLIICVIAAFLKHVSHLAAVQNALAGISIAVCAMVLNAAWKLISKSVVDKITFAVLAVTAMLTILFGVSPVLVVVAASCVGILAKRGEREGGQ